jgi:hypothetical protein
LFPEELHRRELLLRAPDRFRIRIDADDLGGREGFRQRAADAARAAADVERAAAGGEALCRFRNRLQPVAREAAFVLAAVDEIERGDAVGAEFLERDAAAVAERLGHFGCGAQQRRHHCQQAADEMIGVVRGEEIRLLLRQGEGAGARVVLEVAGARHAFQPFLDVARLQAGSAHHVFGAHRALALHGAEQAGAHADEGHAGGHGARHVAEHLVERLPGFFLVYSQSPLGMGRPA